MMTLSLRAGEHDQAEDQGASPPGGDGAGNDAGHRPGPRRRGTRRCLAWPVGWVSTLMSVSLSQWVVHCTRASSRTGLLTPVRWPG